MPVCLCPLCVQVVDGEENVKKCMVSRDEAEGGLEFAGFVAFTCRVRKDTGAVIAQLAEGRCVHPNGIEESAFS